MFRIISPDMFCDMTGFPSQPVPRPSIALSITHRLNTGSEYQKWNALTVGLRPDIFALMRSTVLYPVSMSASFRT